MKYEILETAIRILHERIHDESYLKRLKPLELNKFLETAFDRCGLPKVTKSEVSGPDGEAIRSSVIDLTNVDTKVLEKLVNRGE